MGGGIEIAFYGRGGEVSFWLAGFFDTLELLVR